MQQRDQKTPAFLAYFKDVMDTKGYPTKTMEEYGFQPPLSGLLEQANPMSGQDPDDSGIDISGIVALGGKNWKALVNN